MRKLCPYLLSALSVSLDKALSASLGCALIGPQSVAEALLTKAPKEAFMPRGKKAHSKTYTAKQKARLKKAFLAMLEAKQRFDVKVRQLDTTVTALSIHK